MLSLVLVDSCSQGTIPVIDSRGEQILVPGGTFTMGDSRGDPDETTTHRVTVGPFWLSATMVTWKDWDDYMPGSAQGHDPGTPVTGITWDEARAYCDWLSAVRGLVPVYDQGHVPSGGLPGYRLPREAEWEWAARGSRVSHSTRWPGAGNPDEAGWHEGNSDGIHGVGQKLPNELGLFDMGGNAWEWIEDWYGMYGFMDQSDPTGPDTGEFRVIRGGSWRYPEDSMRVANRNYALPDTRLDDIGFRLCRDASPADEEQWLALNSQTGGTSRQGADIASSSNLPRPPGNALWRNSALPPRQRARDLLGYMTLEEKVGQMTQLNLESAGQGAPILTDFLGSIISGGGEVPGQGGPFDLRDRIESLQGMAASTRLGIPLIYGIDAVHGHNNIRGAVLFPHNIGLGAAGDPALVEAIARHVAWDLQATGAQWNFAPCVAVPQDERWGRTYEGFGEAPGLVSMLGTAYIKGLQEPIDGPDVAATAKHFFGDGGTRDGKDRGDTTGVPSGLLALHMPPYKAAVDAGVRTIMASFSSINGRPMHGSPDLLGDMLRRRLGFDGVVVSDWGAWKLLPGTEEEQIAATFNAGVDIMMVPDSTRRGSFPAAVATLVQDGILTMETVDAAVERILTLKFSLGLFESPLGPRPDHAAWDRHVAEGRTLARRAASASAVVLKNDQGLLPLGKAGPGRSRLLVAGPLARDTAAQCGGWTLEWQGANGQVPGAQSIGEALADQARVDGWDVVLADDGAWASQQPDLAVLILGERPYAEYRGDRTDLHLPKAQSDLVHRLADRGIPVLAILVSGRPMVLDDVVERLDGLVAAWLPGQEGGGIADVITGRVPPTGRLPCSWPRTMDQIPINTGDGKQPLYPLGHGIIW